MSLNIRIELPAATVAAIQEALRTGLDATARECVKSMTTDAVLDAIRKFPYDLKAKSNIPASPTTDSGGKRAQPATFAPGPQAKKTRAELEQPKSFQIFIQNNGGRTRTLNVYEDTTIEEVKSLYQDREAIPPNMQRLVFVGKQLDEGGKTLGEEGITEGAKLIVLLRVVGS